MPPSWRASRPGNQNCLSYVSCTSSGALCHWNHLGSPTALCPRPSFLGPPYHCPSSSLVQMDISRSGLGRTETVPLGRVFTGLRTEKHHDSFCATCDLSFANISFCNMAFSRRSVPQSDSSQG